MGIAGTVPSAIARLTVRGSHPSASAASAREIVPLFECMISVIVIEYSFSLYPSNLGCIKKHIPILTRVQKPEITPRYTGVQHNENVETKVRIERTDVADGPMTKFGPIDPETNRQLEMPLTFERSVIDERNGLEITLTCAYSGEKVQVKRISVAANSKDHISARDLAQLGLPGLIQVVTESVVPNWEYWTSPRQEGIPTSQLKTNHAFLAQMYWLQHVSHGSPRQTLMDYLNMPRSTCNVLLRNLKLEFELPAIS